MKLRYSPTSPYVRKTVIAAIECGLRERIETVETNPWSPDTDLGEDNPLGKVPALITEDGMVLFDSPVICEYLDSQGAAATLFPAPGPARWSALRVQALGDGILDAAVLRLLEGRRPEARQSADWAARQKRAIERSLDALEADRSALDGAVTIGQIAVGAALGYLDFRFAADEWRATRPGLTAWYEAFAARPSMQDTIPVDPA